MPGRKRWRSRNKSRQDGVKFPSAPNKSLTLLEDDYSSLDMEYGVLYMVPVRRLRFD